MIAPRRDPHFRTVRFLVAGFAVLVCLLITSAAVAFEAIRSIERNTSKLLQEQSARTRLVDELQRDEDALSAVFYALVASPHAGVNLDDPLRQLDEVTSRIDTTIQSGTSLGHSDALLAIRKAADGFVSDLRRSLVEGRFPSTEIFASHQRLVDAIAGLASRSYQRAAEAQRIETERTQAWVSGMLTLLGAALILAIPGSILAIRAAVRILRTMEWQTQELARLSARTMSVQEDTARRFSRELHDQFGQTLTAIEANLVAMKHRDDSGSRIGDCLALVKEAMANVRQISQLLRPSVLDDFGLDASLRWLGETFSQRTGVRVQYESTFSRRLSDELETQLFRIAQEALTNVARHSDATRVRMDLSAIGAGLTLTIADNGRGLPEGEADKGTGLISMRARAREAGGTLTVRSSRGQGVTIRVELPLHTERDHATENPDFVSR